MSAERRATPQNSPCQDAAFFSSPLMSDLESDWSPIHDAAFNGRVLALQRLIAQGTCVNLSTLDRVSPLHAACVQGHLACTQLLIQNGADVNSSTVDGVTPLSEACARGHVTLASLLLERGANPSGSGRCNSPIHRAAAKGCIPAFGPMRAGERHQQTPDTPLGHPECLEPLVRYGADVDQGTDQQGSPLHLACSNRHLSTVKKLLELGACVNSSMRGESPLHVAARLSSPELTSVLLQHGAVPSLRNSEGKRPLDLASPDSPVGRLLRQGEVSPLMQLCRLLIRRTVGKRRLTGINELHLPADIKRYLLYRSNAGEPTH